MPFSMPGDPHSSSVSVLNILNDNFLFTCLLPILDLPLLSVGCCIYITHTHTLTTGSLRPRFSWGWASYVSAWGASRPKSSRKDYASRNTQPSARSCEWKKHLSSIKEHFTLLKESLLLELTCNRAFLKDRRVPLSVTFLRICF